MSQRSHRGRKVFRTSLIVLVLVLIGSYVGFALSRPLPVLALTPSLPASKSTPATALSWPAVGSAAIGAVGHGVLASNGTQTALPTASIIKIMTALAVLKQKPLDISQQGPTVTLDATDVSYHDSFVAQDGSVVAVSAGEQISEYQLLQAMLLPSANNIAWTLARWSSGSIDAFTAYANNYAKQLGLNSLNMTDPSGLAGTTVASPQDLVSLGESALANPVIAQIVGQTTATIPVAGQVYNVNGLLGTSGTIGIKTGNNDADPGAYLFAAEQPVGSTTITIVGVIMNNPNLRATLAASLPLITSAAQNFSQTSVINEGQHLGSYLVPWQGKVAVVASRAISLVSWNGTTMQVHLSIHSIRVPTSTRITVGSASVTNSAGKIIGSTPVELHAAISKPSLVWHLKHPLGH